MNLENYYQKIEKKIKVELTEQELALILGSLNVWISLLSSKSKNNPKIMLLETLHTRLQAKLMEIVNA